MIHTIAPIMLSAHFEAYVGLGIDLVKQASDVPAGITAYSKACHLISTDADVYYNLALGAALGSSQDTSTPRGHAVSVASYRQTSVLQASRASAYDCLPTG